MGDADMSSSSSPNNAASGESKNGADDRSAEESTKKLKLTDSEEQQSATSPQKQDQPGGEGAATATTENSNEEVGLSPPTPPPDPEVGGKKEGDKEAEGAAAVVEEEEEDVPRFTTTVMYNKNALQLSLSSKTTVLELKQMIKERVGVDVNLQKVLLKGIAKDEVLLKDLGVTENTKKILVIGSSIQDVLKVKEVPTMDGKEKEGGSGASADAANWCSAPTHKKVIDKGLPDDVMPGILDEREPLPPFPLTGMYSSKGSKVRLTFKYESDELWIGTKERTEKVPIGSIRNVTSQPITGYEHYHILAIQLGPTEASRFFVYWVPAQYVAAILDALGP